MVKVLHIKSNVVTDNKPKLPTKEQIEYGEIAVNYAADHETISLRNSNDEIKTFSSDEYYTKQKLGTAFTDSTVTDVLNNELKTKLNVADFNSYSGSVSNNEQVIAGGISELKNEISGKQDKGNYALKGESYTKSESDTKYLAKTDYDTDKTTFATKTDVDGKLADKLDKTTYESDKTTMNNKIDSKSNTGHTHTLKDITDYNTYDTKIQTAIGKKQNQLTAGNGIKIEKDVISTTLDTTIFRFVDALPTENIELNKLYFVPSTTKGEQNIYTEYAYHDNAWEILGQYKADVDLTLYAKTTDVDTKLADSEQVIAGGISELKNKVDAATATTYTKTDVDNKLAAKLDTSAYTKVNISDFATAANTYTKSEVDTALKGKQDVLTIDDKLDKTSTNAVQNKAIATELENLMKAISGVLNDINERLNTLSNTVAKQIKNSTE